MVATGTPAGIMEVESSASSPCSAEESIGTPMTGRMSVRSDHAGKVGSRSGTRHDHLDSPLFERDGVPCVRSGERCALEMVISVGSQIHSGF